MKAVDAPDAEKRLGDLSRFAGGQLGSRIETRPSVLFPGRDFHGDAVLVVPRLDTHTGGPPRDPGARETWYFDVTRDTRIARFICRRRTAADGHVELDETLPSWVRQAISRALDYAVF